MGKQKINWKQKLTSRKLWVAIIGIVAGLAAVFGVDENEYTAIAGAVIAAANAVAYIMGEAKIDAADRFNPAPEPEEDTAAEEKSKKEE
jgi:uncharacterized membrane protein